MLKTIRLALVIAALFSFTGCSEITESQVLSDAPQNNTPDPVPDPAPIPDPTPTTFSLSGNIAIAPLIQIDSDINDPFAATDVDNGTFDRAQVIRNFSTVNGFVTQLATNRTINGDRFSDVADEDDVFQLNLQKDQVIRLQVVDFAAGGDFQGDLDLYLLNGSGALIASSVSAADEFENVSVPADGFYYILVNAFSGASKYILTLDNLSINSASTYSSHVDFIPKQAVVKYTNTLRGKSSSLNAISIQTSHSDNRITLAHFNYAAKANIQPSAFETSLFKLNSNSFYKFKTLKTIKALNQQDNVEYAEPNYIRRALATPNDSLYSLQWHYPAINLPLAWDITDGDRVQDVIVAVIDTGVFLAHADLSNQLVAGFDFIADPTNANDGDGIDNNPNDPGDSALQNKSSWHGTHVAGTIAAESNNNIGGAGVSWAAKIMPLRVLGVNGGTSYDTIQAVLFAAGLSNDSGTVPSQIADVINLSLGGSGNSSAEQNVFTAARNAGVIIIAAAGNENTNQLSFPASYDGVISVSATGLDNSLAPYSNFGSEIDIAAPGGNQAVDLDNDNNSDGILSTLVDESSGTNVSSYAFYQGTSMAAPHMAGVVALMRAVHPTLTPDELDSLISSGNISTDLGSVGRDNSFGYGLIDALKAVQQAQTLNNGGVLPPQPAIITATPNQLSLGSNITNTTITIANIGDTAAQISSVSNDASWLTVSENSVDVNNLGTYSIVIDKTGLVDNASYLTTITFNINTGAALTVPVSMINGSLSNIGQVGTLYLLLFDSDDDVSQQVIPSNQGNGVYSYTFNNISAGDYTLLVGSDIDNDVLICQTGESCGAYPTLNTVRSITVDSNLTNIDFTADILASFSANLLSAANNASSTIKGVKRLPVSLSQANP